MPLLPRIVLASAASGLLYAAGSALGPLGTPFLLFVPLGGLILAARGPLAASLLWCAITTVVVTAAFGEPAAIGFLIPLGGPTVVAAIGLDRAWSFERTAVAAILAWALGILSVYLVACGGDVHALAANAREQLSQSFDLAISTSGSVAGSNEAIAQLRADRDEWISGMLELLPAIAVMAGAAIVLLNLVLVRGWTGAASGVSLRLWRAPEPLIWALIVTGFGMFVPVYAVTVTARNVFLILLGCYFCQGLAIVSFYLDRMHLPRGVRLVGYLLIAVQHVVAMLVLALGVFDLWGNFRRLGVGPSNLGIDPDGD